MFVTQGLRREEEKGEREREGSYIYTGCGNARENPWASAQCVCVCIYLTSGGHVLKTRVLGSPELGKRRRGGPKAPLGELSS